MRCLGCEEPLPPRRGRGQPRKYCSETCRERTRRRRRRAEAATRGWQAWGPLRPAPLDPVTRKTRTIEALARASDGDRSAAPEDQLVQAIIETGQIAFVARRLAGELPHRLGVRAQTLADGLRSLLQETFPEFR